MRSICTLVILLFCLMGTVHAQGPNWLWAKSAGGPGINAGTSISNDGNGNEYVAGYFGSLTIIFGDDTLTNNADTSGSNIFISKYDSLGNVIWAKSAGGTSNDRAYGITVDINGNVYLTGSFTSPFIVFGGDTLTNNSTIYGSNIFIAKYDPSGDVVWAKSVPGAGNDAALGISTDINGYVFVTGYYNGYNFIFGSDTLINNLTVNGSSVFVAKFDSSGNVLWAASAGGAGSNQGTSISTDGSGNAYVTGYFNSPLIVFGNSTLSNNGNPIINGGNAFVVKYDPLGNAIWAQSVIANGSDIGYGICTDVNGNSYVTGTYYFGSVFVGSDSLVNGGTGNVFIIKYDSSGNSIWAKNAETNGDEGTSIGTDGGNIYVAGYFRSSVIVFGSDTLINAGYSSAFIAKYDASGNIIWVKSAGGERSSCFANDISIDAKGNSYITGYFEGDTIDFGINTLVSDSNYDVFVAKLDGSYPAGIKTISNSSPITIYPNPSTGTFYFSGLQNESTIEVYNVLGEMVFSTAISTDNNQINLSAQAKGIYFYKIHSTTQDIQQGKMVKE